MSNTRPHDFWIQGQGVEWHWLALNGNDVANYSGCLGRQVTEDRLVASSRVQLCQGVSEDAMKTIISSIPSQDDDGDLPVLCINDLDPESGFNELLSLAIGCWQYDCAIPPACKKFAKDFHSNWTLWYGHEFYEGASVMATSKAINWMFIALVFGWEKIFTNTSRIVVVKYKARDDNPNLPQDFQELVGQTRKRKMLQSYSFVQKSWMSFYESNTTNELLNKIHGHFEDKFRIELQNPLSNTTYKQVNPDSLLIELAAIVKENEVQSPVRLPSPPLVFDAPVTGPPTHGTGRSGLFGPAAVSIGRDILHAARRSMRPRPPEPRSSSSSSGEQSWRKMQSLEKDMNDFRTQFLDGISLQDQKYVKLRNKHIKPAVSGFQPKIKRL